MVQINVAHWSNNNSRFNFSSKLIKLELELELLAWEEPIITIINDFNIRLFHLGHMSLQII